MDEHQEELEAKRAGEVIERLLVDPVFRAEFRRDPVGVCRAFGLEGLAVELGSAKAMHTLEMRESRSSLAGVVMAVAAEGIGAVELRGLVGHGLHGPARSAALHALKGPRAAEAGLERGLRPHGQAAHLEAALGRQEQAAGGSGGGSAPGSQAGAPSSAAPAPSGGAAGSLGSAPAPSGGAAGSSSPAPAPSGGAAGSSGSAVPSGGVGGSHAPAAAAGAVVGGGSGASSSPDAAMSGGGAGAAVAAQAGDAMGQGGGGSASAAVAELLSNPRLSLPPAARALFQQGGVDPRVTSLLESAVQHHAIVVGDLESVADPVHAQAIDIVSVDGERVGPGNVAARDLITEIAALDPSVRPSEIGTPWPIQAQGFFTDAAHQGRLHLAFVSPADYQPGGAGAGAPGVSPQLGGDAGGPVAATPSAEGVAQAAAAQIATDNAPPPAQPPVPVADGAQGSPVGQASGQGLADASGQAGSGQGAVPASDQAGSGQGAMPASDQAGSGQGQAVGPGQAPTQPATRGYVNPLPADARIGRTDMGVDVDLNPGEAIVAPGASRVLGIMPNWYAGQPYVALQLLDGPMQGHNYYVAEQIDPSVTPGQIVQAGQPIGHFASSGTGIEMGWAGPGQNWEQTLAQATGHDNASENDHANTPAGVSFRNFLDSLGSRHAPPSAAADPGTAGAGAGGADLADATGAGVAGAAGSGAAGSGAAGSGAAGSGADSVGSAGDALAGAGEHGGAPGQPAPGTGVFRAAKPHEHRFHRHTVQFLATVQPGPESPLYRGGHAADALAGQPAQSGQGGAGVVDPQQGQGAGVMPEPSGGTLKVSSSLLTAGQAKFAARVAQLTGLSPRVIAAWELAEESGSFAQQREAAGNFDWLNIGYTDSAKFGTGDSIWSDPISAADATAGWIKGQDTIPGYGRASAGIRAILESVGKSPREQMMAIANSGWASSGYDGGRNLIGTYDELSDIQIVTE